MFSFVSMFIGFFHSNCLAFLLWLPILTVSVKISQTQRAFQYTSYNTDWEAFMSCYSKNIWVPAPLQVPGSCERTLKWNTRDGSNHRGPRPSSKGLHWILHLGLFGWPCFAYCRQNNREVLEDKSSIHVFLSVPTLIYISLMKKKIMLNICRVLVLNVPVWLGKTLPVFERDVIAVFRVVCVLLMNIFY